MTAETAVKAAVKGNSENNEKNDSADGALLSKIAVFDWFDAIENLGLSDFTYHFVSAGVLRIEANQGRADAILDLLPANEVLVTPDSMTELSEALSCYFAQPINVRVNYTDIRCETPAERQKKAQVDADQAVITAFTQHPIVQQVVNEFEARILTNTIKEMDKKPS